MDEQEPLLQALRALSSYFFGGSTLRETLEQVSKWARSALRVPNQVGITLIVDGRPGTYVFTDPEIPLVEQAQYETGDGPCLDAYRTGEPVLVTSTRGNRRYPKFCEVAAERGIHSVVSFPLRVPSGQIGAMNHYAFQERAFGRSQVEVGERFAAQASYLVANAQAYWDARTLSENLTEAIKSRAEIEQAKGVVMARTGCDATRAFELLREQSQRENRKVRDVAGELVRHAAWKHRPQSG